MTSLRDRLLSKAVINWETGCWEWTASCDHRGYGRIRVGGRAGRKVRVHRLSYEMTYGPIPEGMVIDHLCRVRRCLNPDHLEVVSGAVNILRGISVPAVNAAKTHCIRGHEFTPENTYRASNGRGGHGRGCRACLREYPARKAATA